jgi:hypothetical protein
MEHPAISPDLAPNFFGTFPKMKSALEGWIFQGTEDNQKMWRRHWKLFHNRSSKIFRRWQHRWAKCTAAQAEYCEGNSSQ